jgi:hypothetical protein
MSDTPKFGARDSGQGTPYHGSPATGPGSPGETAPIGTEMPPGRPGGYPQPGPYGPPGQPGQPGASRRPVGHGQPRQGWPRTADLRPHAGPAPVLVSFPGPARQRRPTVAFRAILAVPQLLALSILSAAGGVVAFISWWAALFTGQLPDWASELLTGLVRWSARVSAYLYLVTDAYPPFTLDDADYPVRLLTKPTRLNRLAVLFRCFLLLPVALVAGVASIGLAVLSVVAWVITVITGRMPTALQEAFSAIIRFTARYAGYAYMVTPEYPAGLYGDPPKPALGPTPRGAASLAMVDASPFATAAPQHAPTAAVQAPRAPESTGDHAGDPWRLVLSSRAKTLVTASLVIGVLGLAACVVFIGPGSSAANSAANRANALANLNRAYGQLFSVLKPFPTQSATCGQRQSLSCITALDRKVATAFDRFGTSLQQAGIPTAYSADEAKLMSDTTTLTRNYIRLAGARSPTQYEDLVVGMDITSTPRQWRADFSRLESALTNG